MTLAYSSSLGIFHRILAYIPFKAKRYMKKWMKKHDNDIGQILVDVGFDGFLRCNIFIDDTQTSTIIYATSFVELWENVLEEIAKIENMRNAYELCIWLDFDKT